MDPYCTLGAGSVYIGINIYTEARKLLMFIANILHFKIEMNLHM